MHIANATINKVDVVASWNFKHLVNLDRIKKYNSVNLKEGYSIIEIRTPREIMKEKKKFDAVKLMRDIRDKLHEEYEKEPAKRERNFKKARAKYMKKTELV